MSNTSRRVRFRTVFLICCLLGLVYIIISYLNVDLRITSSRSRDLIYKYWNNKEGSNSKIERLKGELESMLNYPINNDILLEESNGVFDFNNRPSISSVKSGCTRPPHLHEVLFNNNYWQIMRLSGNLRMYLYNAITDRRESEPKIRIVGVADTMYTKTSNYSQHYCQLWTSNNSLIAITNATLDYAWRWGTGGPYHPYIVTCHLDPSLIEGEIWPLPQSVSLVVDNKCQVATNQLKIVNKEEQVGRFGVCFKWLDFSDVDISQRIIEMVELLRILGVSGIHFPYMDAHSNVDKVLNYYKNEINPVVHVKPFTLPGPQLNFPLLRHLYIRRNNNAKIKQELVPYIDCFLENMNRYKYIAIIDIDEVILPVLENNYEELFTELENVHGKEQSFCFQMKLFVDRMTWPNETLIGDIKDSHPEFKMDPNLPYLMNKLHFDKGCLCNSGRRRNVKCFHNTGTVLVVHNHSPVKCLPEIAKCSVRVDLDKGYTHHHKDSYFCASNSTIDSEEFLRDPFGYDDNIRRHEALVVQRRDLIMKYLDL